MHTGVRICRIRQCRQFLSLFSALCLKQEDGVWLSLLPVSRLCRGIVCAGAATPRAGGAGGAPWGRAATANHRQDRGGGPGTPGITGTHSSQSSHTVPWLGAPSARVQDCRPRVQTPSDTSQCHPSTLCFPAEPLLPLGTVVPTAAGPSLQHSCCRGSRECSSSGQGQKDAPSYSRGLLVIQILWCSKGQCRVQWKQGKIWIRNGEQGTGEERGCELGLRVSVPFLTAISENVTVEAQDTKSCHSLSHSKHLTLLPLGNSLSHWIL